MKKLYQISLIVLSLFMVACTDNPLETIEGTGWQKERNIISILVEGQIGTAVIERDFDDAKIKIFAKEENIADISKVEIKNIELSHGATTINKAGTTLDFSSGASTIAIMSGAGETLNWEVSLLPFVSDLEGDWYIGEIGLYADMWSWESWGWEKYEKINNYLPELSPELDNILSFTVEGADENGNPFGTYEHKPGNDGLYGSFTDANQGWNFNERFRKIPTGSGTWLRDFERNKVIITDENRRVYELDLEVFVDTKEVSIKAEVLYQSELFNWDEQAWAYEELAHMSKSMWYRLTREYVPQAGNDIRSLTVANQVGDATIDAGNKTVTVVIEDNGTDISAIEITGLDVSFAASSNKTVGQILDFSGDYSTEITVTSEAGEAVVWTINLELDIDVSDVSLAGTWSIDDIGVYADLFTWESWGWEKNELLTNYLPNASTELDNTITFVVIGKDAQDRPYGTYENNAGTDGAYGNFVSDDASWPETDFNSRYRKVPTGTGTWILDGETVTITDGGGTDFVLTLEVKTGSTIALSADVEFLSDQFDWDVQNYSYEETAHMSKRMWYNLSK
ncbi:hypothetical protein FUA26_00675 [Seonamhaeicola algicola]|uniref:Uncharacterized protein n=1 Tax=Seonamhaeicola algicola TaxID=1719036 RepID=A0A5C7B570_9FLAO|nr:hypothetical protein [Seonamhaeicola algicola]TXE15053.1 hypothetical protein FUA26_00675 [Seonamhaeicola algicola]